PDDGVQGDKTFSVTLSNATGGATIDQASNPAVVTIYQDQGQLQFGAQNYIVAEANAALTVTVDLNGLVDLHPSQGELTEGPGPFPPLYALTVNYTTEDGTAHSGERYLPVSGTLTFVYGQANIQTIAIPILNNTDVDGDQTFYLTLSDPVGGISLGPNSTVPVTVLDEDAATNQSSTTLTSDFAGGSTYGQTVTFTAVVGAASGTPTGSVDFGDTTTGQDLGSFPLTVVNGVDEASVSESSFDVGSHTIVASYTSDDGSFVNSQDSLVQSVAPATLTVAADDKAKLYGSDNPSLTATITGFVDGDTASVVSGDASLTTTAMAASGVGDYRISAALGTLSAANYTFAFAEGTLSVTPATLTVTANAQTKIYGDADPALTYQATGFKFNDTTATVLGGALSRAAGELVAAGPYAIDQGTLAANTNYVVSFTGSSLAITPATLSVTADNKTRLYGSPNPPLSDTITGFVNGDTSASLTTAPTLSTTAAANSSVGSYTITAGGAADPNYAISYISGTLGVTPAPLTITAENQTMTYGGPLPALTAGYSGFVNGDTSASLTTVPMLSTTAAAGSPVGSYTITAGGAADPNYTISYI
ncbi:MAG: MBG domain-containing protein, partial [Pirellulales bacterium]